MAILPSVDPFESMERPWDRIDQVPALFVPNHVTSMEQWSDIVCAYSEPMHALADAALYKQQHIFAFRFFYLDYDRLETMVHDMTSVDQQDAVLHAIEAEVTKVYEFAALKLGEIERRIAYYEQQLAAHSPPSYSAQLDQLVRVESELGVLSSDMEQLARFAKLNHKVLLLVIRHCHQRLVLLDPHEQHAHFQKHTSRVVTSKPFYQPETFDKLIASLSHQYGTLRQAMDHLRDSLLTRPSTPTSTASYCSLAQAPLLSQDDEDGLGERKVPNYTTIFVTRPDSASPDATTTSPLSSGSSIASVDSCATSATSLDAAVPREPKRTVKQFLVHPDNLVEVLVFMAKYLPHQSQTSPIPPVQIDTLPTDQSFLQGLEGKQAITTVYLDTPDFKYYTQRAAMPSSQTELKTLRLRWYGKGLNRVALEEKKHCGRHVKTSTKGSLPHQCPPEHCKQYRDCRRLESLSCSSRIQHRVWLKAKHVDPWLQGDWSLRHTLEKASCQHVLQGSLPSLEDPTVMSKDMVDKMTQQVLQMEAMVRNQPLKPVLKTVCSRTTFVEDSLVVSIDKDMVMMRCDGDDETITGPTHQSYPYAPLPVDRATRFPLAIIKLSFAQLTEAQSSWVDELCMSPLLEPVPAFSAYLYGVRVLLPDKVRDQPLSWVPTITSDLSHPDDRGSLVKRRHKKFSRLTNGHRFLPTPSSSSETMIASDYTSPAMTPGPSTPTSRTARRSQSALTIPSRQRISQDDATTPLLKQGASGVDPNSYCSFDHPTSSRSDPLKCQVCLSRRQLSYDIPKSCSTPTLSQSEHKAYLVQAIRRFWPVADKPKSTTASRGTLLPAPATLSGKHTERSASVIDVTNTLTSSVRPLSGPMKYTLLSGLMAITVTFFFFVILSV